MCGSKRELGCHPLLGALGSGPTATPLFFHFVQTAKGSRFSDVCLGPAWVVTERMGAGVLGFQSYPEDLINVGEEF